MAPRSSLFGRTLLLCLILLSGCTTAARITLPQGAGVRATPVDTLLAEHPMASKQNILAVPLGQTDALSYHLVQIRMGETPHVHAAHDLTVILVRGTGTLYVARQVVDMRTGDAAVIPRGTPHHFVNTGGVPAAAFVTFAPPYDGKDQVPVPETAD